MSLEINTYLSTYRKQLDNDLTNPQFYKDSKMAEILVAVGLYPESLEYFEKSNVIKCVVRNMITSSL
jgi:hypothetical protein